MSCRKTYLAPLFACLLASGCFLQRGGLGEATDDGSIPGLDGAPEVDGSSADADAPLDATPPPADSSVPGPDADPPVDDGGATPDGAVLMDAATPDAGPPDAGPPDTGPPDTGPPDAGPPDAGPPDAGPPDAGPPDAGPPDTGPPDAGPPSCEDIYNTTARFVCAQRADECEMYVDLGGATSNCTAFCAAFGGTAIRCYREAEPTNPNCGYMSGATRSCSANHDDEICVCSR